MKTVQDYLDLGLVFVGGDKLRSSTKNKDEKEVCMSGLCIAHQRYCDGFRGGNAIFFYPSEWTPSSFAWRNNDGGKPEYKGLIDVCFEGGNVSNNESAIDFEWSLDDENYIVKWRPVVLQSDDTHGNDDESFMLPISIDSPELREALKLPNDYMETNPKFTIREEAPSRTMAVNIEGRDYLIASHKPEVSPKEDKPMKPVYTAEMHAKNERPQVGSECEALCMDATNSKHVWTKAEILMHHDGNECAVYCIDTGVLRWADEFKPIAKTIKVNGFDVPAPTSEAPMINDEYFTPQTGYEVFYCKNKWRDDRFDERFLSRGLVHSTESAAIAHAKAMIGIDPNA